MITRIYSEEDGTITAQTDGCGCCSVEIYDKDDILYQLRENFKIIEESAKVLNIDLKELLIKLSF